VVREDAPGRADARREPFRDVARPGADVGDRRALGDLQGVQRDVRLFFLLALAPLEPLRALIAHDRRKPPAADRVDAGLRLRREAAGHGERDEPAEDDATRAWPQMTHVHRIARRTN